MSETIRQRTLAMMNKYGVEPQKRFSQNFLVDDSAVSKILSSVPFEQSQEVVEIGPGLGSLTFGLAEKAKHLTAVEFDRNMVKALGNELQKPNFALIQEDFLKTDLNMFHVKQTSYIGNLPYEITRDIIEKINEDPDFIYFGFMVQKDLTDKLLFKEGSPLNNPYSVFLALRGQVSVLLDLNPGSFYPSPKVASSFLVLKSQDNSFASSACFKLIKQMFVNPRKNLSNNLRGSKYENVLELVKEQKIPGTMRPHELSLSQWRAVLKAYSSASQKKD
jgi:16S rRNA (adenine1518-N6/adenine1519-N6)-dimethyltransferase